MQLRFVWSQLRRQPDLSNANVLANLYKARSSIIAMKRTLTRREEANVITCNAFRNGLLEDLHSGAHSPVLEVPNISRITDEEMKKLMIESSARAEKLLRMKEESPDEYWQFIESYAKTHT